MDGYQYTLNHRGQTYWRCVNRLCEGRVTTDENDQLISSNNNHNHQPNETEIQVKVINQMKERAKNETTAIITGVWAKTDKDEPFFQGTKDGVFMFATKEI